MKTLRFFCGNLLSALLTLSISASAAESPYLYGIHDHSPDSTPYASRIKNVVGGGWITATVAIGADPNNFGGEDFSYYANQGYTVVCRINYGYFPDGTIPAPWFYDNFAARCRNFVQSSTGCTIWLIGNETNLSAEWPLNATGAYVSPQDYANCFRKVYNAIKAVRPNDKVISQALAPWAGPYGAGNLNGYNHDGVPLNWVQYMNQMLTAIKSSGGIDGIALHINSRGYAYGDIHSAAQVNAGGQNLYWSFYVYKDWINLGIPSSMWNLPLYATECNGYFYWKGGHPENPAKHYEPGWMQEIYAEINRYNQTAYASGKPVFRCINMYRWCGGCDGWNIDGDNPYKNQMLSDLDGAVAQRNTWLNNDSIAISVSAPSSVAAGSSFSASVQMKNNGVKQWKSGVANPHRLGSQSPQDNTFWGSFNRLELPTTPINPGQTVTFNFTCTAPATPGNYTFAWKMLQESVEWFGQTASRPITVTSAAAVIVDNVSANFTASANWATGTSAPGKYGSNYRFRTIQAISDPATWTGSLPSSGSYRTYAWWTGGSNRGTNVSYIVYYNGGSSTVRVNQQINGGIWNSLGTFNFLSGANQIKVSCWATDTNHVVIADAVKWEQ